VVRTFRERETLNEQLLREAGFAHEPGEQKAAVKPLRDADPEGRSSRRVVLRKIRAWWLRGKRIDDAVAEERMEERERAAEDTPGISEDISVPWSPPSQR
jgi:hypothetical protein